MMRKMPGDGNAFVGVRGGTGADDPTGFLTDRRARITGEIILIEKEMAEMEEFVASVCDPVEREILTYRYLEGMKWSAVSRKMGFSERTVYYIHKKICSRLQ